MSTIEAILEGGEWVKGHATKTKWKQRSMYAFDALYR